MYNFGTIVLVPFPFTDLSATKVRPALIVSKNNLVGDDCIVCFISSNIHEQQTNALLLKANNATGLKVDSVVRFDKIATLSKSIILGEIGSVEPDFLRKHAEKFSGVFGFAQ